LAFLNWFPLKRSRPGTEHVLGFLKDKMPESLRFLERVREEDGDEGYEEVLEEARDLLAEFLEIKRKEGEEVAERFLDFERSRIRLQALLEEWHETDDESENRELRNQIAEIVGKQVDREIAEGQQELNKLKEEVKEIEEELAELEERRGAIIEAELEEILPGEETRRMKTKSLRKSEFKQMTGVIVL
jgi:seryl-tRNA synthetase